MQCVSVFTDIAMNLMSQFCSHMLNWSWKIQTAIFPMLFVEQKRGWSSIQGPFPTFLRIQDIARRVLEFLLDLDVGKIRRERAEIRRSLALLERRWTDRRSDLQERAGRLARLRGLPAQPTAEFAHVSEVGIDIFHDEDWRPLSDVLAKIGERIGILEASEVSVAGDAAPEIEGELRKARARLDELTAVLETVREDFTMQLQEQRAIESRLEALESDLKRNQDALKLKKLGSALGLAAGYQSCPTCHQDISSELLPTVTSVGMALEENITFVRSQLELYRATLASSEQNLTEYRAHYSSTDEEVTELQRKIRGLRQALIQPASSPSRAMIEEIVRLQAKADRLRSIQEGADSLIDELRSIAAEWAALQDRLVRVAKDDLSDADRRKASDLQDTIGRHLTRYGFKSFQPSEIHLSQDNFRPLVHARKDDEIVETEIGFEVSASDAIRLKWAYYLAMLSISRRNATDHPGLVIFDEPGQQEIETPSLTSFLEWSAENLTDRQQVVVATSEPRQSIDQILHGHRANVMYFDGFILQTDGDRALTSAIVLHGAFRPAGLRFPLTISLRSRACRCANRSHRAGGHRTLRRGGSSSTA
jgi:prepilin-type processing-associated H-X9-DG protein